MLWIFGDERSSAGAKETGRHGNGSLNLQGSFRLYPESFTLGRAHASSSNTQGGSPVRESRTPGSVRGVLSNEHPYRDSVRAPARRGHELHIDVKEKARSDARGANIEHFDEHRTKIKRFGNNVCEALGIWRFSLNRRDCNSRHGPATSAIRRLCSVDVNVLIPGRMQCSPNLPSKTCCDPVELGGLPDIR
jgi:hypothetical protein